MVSFQSRLPEQKTDPLERYIPPEILEQILLNLPINSLLRFSCASTSWNSTITSPQFLAKRDCLRKTVIINDNPSFFDVQNSFCCPLSAISNNPVRHAASSLPVCPFRGPVELEAFCDHLWCVQNDNSLYLWDPSTGACKKLPDSAPLHPNGFVYKVAYGLGYDAVDDDYKLLEILRGAPPRLGHRTFLYSLKKGFWRKIDTRIPHYTFWNSNGLCVNGALNWMVNVGLRTEIVVTFKFSSEKYGRLSLSSDDDDDAYSNYDLLLHNSIGISSDVSVEGIVVLRSKLCVFANYGRNNEHDTTLGLWVMEEYGVVESWTKLYTIRYQSIAPIVRGTTLRPLYIYEDGRVVIRASCGKWGIFVYKDTKVVARSKIIPRSKNAALDSDDEESRSFGYMVEDDPPRVCGEFVYVESLASSMKLAALLLRK